MIYYYDKNRVDFYKLSNKNIMLMLLIFIMLISTIFLIGKKLGMDESMSSFSDAEKAILIRTTDSFDENKFALMLNELNVKFPHIVFAQAIVETGNWKSRIFIENHNLFGMKEAKTRVTAAIGTQYNHAYYNHWRESVYDYAFYQCRYLYNIRTDADYFEYLKHNYAEDTSYVDKIKSVINDRNLERIFK